MTALQLREKPDLCVQDLIDFYEAIPEDKWQTGWFWNERLNCCCAIGHTCVDTHEVINPVSQFIAQVFFNNPDAIYKINDGKCEEYQQSTPKQRVLAALRDKL